MGECTCVWRGGRTVGVGSIVVATVWMGLGLVCGCDVFLSDA